MDLRRARVAAILLFHGLLVYRLSWMAEDAYISFRFARNLADGHGPVFNPGMARVDGYTNFLWVLLAAALERAQIPAYIGIYPFTLGAGLLTLAALHRFARAGLGQDEVTADAALLLLAWSPPFAKWVTSGMETSAFTAAFFLAATGLAFAEDLGLWAAAVAALALSLLRAEAIGWVVVLVALAAALRRAEGRPIRPMVTAAALGVGPGWGAWYAWRTWYYGSWVPNTVVAKAELSSAVILRGLRYDALFFLLQLTPLLLPVALVITSRQIGRARAAWLGALCAAFPAWAALVGGDYMFFFRFLVPGLPFLALAGAIALGPTLRRPRRGGLALAAVTVTGLLSAANITVFPERLLARFDTNVSGDDVDTLILHHGHFRSVGRTPRDMYQEAMAVRAFTQPGDVVTVHAVGNAAYFNPDRLFLDGCGLVTRAIAELRTRVTADTRAGHEKCVAWWRLPPERATVVEVRLLRDASSRAALRAALLRYESDQREHFEALHLVPDVVVYRSDSPTWRVVVGGVRVADGTADADAWAAWRAKVEALATGALGAGMFAGEDAAPSAERPDPQVEVLVPPSPRAAPASPDGPPPNVVVVVWDGVRADHLSLYGHGVLTTPRLDAWGPRAEVYERAITPSTSTLPAHASLFTGLPASAHGAGGRSAQLDDDLLTFAEALQERGYDTWSFSTNPILSENTNLLQGFATIEHPWRSAWRSDARALRDRLRVEEVSTADEPREDTPRTFRHTGPIATQALTSWLHDRRSDRPFLAFIHLAEAQTPRSPPMSWRSVVMSPAEVARSTQIDGRPRALLTWTATGEGPAPADADVLTRVYDAAIREMDDATGALLDELDGAGVLDHTLFVLTSDHGELLGDHGAWGHQLAVHDALLRVPLVVLRPGGAGAGRRPQAVSTTAVYRMILEAAGVRDLPPAPEVIVTEHPAPESDLLRSLGAIGAPTSRWGGATIIEAGGFQRTIGEGVDRVTRIGGGDVPPGKAEELDAALTTWRAATQATVGPRARERAAR